MLNLNNALLESIKTNKLVININEEDYLKINQTISKLKNKYQKELIFFIENNKKDLNTIKKHSNLIKKIINDVLKEFDIIEKYNICVFLTGSFARNTNKKNSDIDLQFTYPEKYKDKIFKYEEMIYYIIATILNLERSNVHSMLITRLNRENIDYLEQTLDDGELSITLHSSTKDISYKYRGNTKRRIYLQYGNNNTIDEVFKYLKNEVENNNKEWAHTFYVFTKKEEFNNHYNQLYQYEKKILTKERLINRISRIKQKIEEVDKDLSKLDKTNISQIKLIYQKKEFSILNEYISYIRDLTLLNNQDWLYINYFDNQIYLKDDINFKHILNYIFAIFSLAEPLEKDYSLHSNKYINIENYDTLEKLIKDINKKILTTIKKRKKK